MASIWQVTWEWNGFVGAPGYTNLYYLATAQNANEAVEAVGKSRFLLAGLADAVAGGVTIGLVTDVRLIRDTDGLLQNIFTVTGTVPVTSTHPVAPHSAVSGGCIDWLTGVVHGKHMMTGRTFVVPMHQGAYDGDGSINTTTITELATAAESMRSAAGPQFGVWGRPRKEKTVDGKVIPALEGLWHQAVGSRVPDKSVVLRSRRD